MSSARIRALVPIKPAGAGKSRLGAGLDESERAALTRCMAADVLRALAASPRIAQTVLLGADEPATHLAGTHDCRLLPDDGSGDLCANLDRAAALLAAEGTTTLLILPADLPVLSGADLDSLLDAHRGGVTVAVACDGGTNALVLTPPGAIGCRFGPDSAARHLAAARARGLDTLEITSPAFARDIDTVDDVRWLCGQRGDSATVGYLRRSGICARLKAGPP